MSQIMQEKDNYGKQSPYFKSSTDFKSEIAEIQLTVYAIGI
jgi:hypothetical protein